MPIPKIIYQTFRTQDLPFLNKIFIKRFRTLNRNYEYEFFDDERIEKFLQLEFSEEYYNAYKKIQIGAAKADFFRYAILYKKGGIYLDIDSNIKVNLDSFILPDDKAIIATEDHPPCYVQWGLIFEAGHPFLKRTLELILQNIKLNKYPHDVHSMTGPGVYTEAINQCISENPNTPFRVLGVDYAGFMSYVFPFSKFFLYKKGDHWTKQQLKKTVLRD